MRLRSQHAPNYACLEVGVILWGPLPGTLRGHTTGRQRSTSGTSTASAAVVAASTLLVALLVVALALRGARLLLEPSADAAQVGGRGVAGEAHHRVAPTGLRAGVAPTLTVHCTTRGVGVVGVGGVHEQVRGVLVLCGSCTDGVVGRVGVLAALVVVRTGGVVAGVARGSGALHAGVHGHAHAVVAGGIGELTGDLLTVHVGVQRGSAGVGVRTTLLVADAIQFVSDQELKDYEPTGNSMKIKVSNVKLDIVKPKINTNKPGPKVLVEHAHKKLYVHIQNPDDHDSLMKLKQTCNDHPGLSDIILVLGVENKSAIKLNFKVDAGDILTNKLADLLGRDRVVLK